MLTPFFAFISILFSLNASASLNGYYNSQTKTALSLDGEKKALFENGELAMVTISGKQFFLSIDEKLIPHERHFLSAAFSPDSTKLAAYSYSHLYVWDVSNSELGPKQVLKQDLKPLKSLEKHFPLEPNFWPNQVSFSSDGKSVAVTTRFRLLGIYEISQNQSSKHLNIFTMNLKHLKNYSEIAYVNVSSRPGSGFQVLELVDKKLQIREVSLHGLKKEVLELEVPLDLSVQLFYLEYELQIDDFIKFSPDGAIVFAINPETKEIYIWSAKTGKLINEDFDLSALKSRLNKTSIYSSIRGIYFNANENVISVDLGVNIITAHVFKRSHLKESMFQQLESVLNSSIQERTASYRQNAVIVLPVNMADLNSLYKLQYMSSSSEHLKVKEDIEISLIAWLRLKGFITSPKLKDHQDTLDQEWTIGLIKKMTTGNSDRILEHLKNAENALLQIKELSRLEKLKYSCSSYLTKNPMWPFL